MNLANRVTTGLCVLLLGTAACAAPVDVEPAAEETEQALDEGPTEKLYPCDGLSAGYVRSFPAPDTAGQEYSFEVALRDLGCKFSSTKAAVAVYPADAGGSMYWLLTKCPDTAAVRQLVASYAYTKPVESRFVSGAYYRASSTSTQCSYASASYGTKLVMFDPGCPTCRW